jgi:Family of unknown function (DUF6065)
VTAPEDPPLDGTPPPAGSLQLKAYPLTSGSLISISPAPSRREWMEHTENRFANRCLPLLMANQAGWSISLAEPVEVEWSGREGIDQVSVFGSKAVRRLVTSHFGSGIATFRIPFLFRTPPEYNLLVRGPANLPKDGIAPLEGLVETDWTAATFTMNWQLTRPLHRVGFEANEPICMLVPMRRGELEAFAPSFCSLDEDREIEARYRAWHEERNRFNRDLKAGEDAAVKLGWQRDYLLGRDPGSAAVASTHQTKLPLRPFVKRTGDA